MNDYEDDNGFSKAAFWVAAGIAVGPLLISFIFAIIGLLRTYSDHPILTMLGGCAVIPWFAAAIWFMYDKLRKKYNSINERGDDGYDG